ncbi:hypothetical protein WNY97_06515 [Pseudoalteromonas fuliginea]|uniref:hypothetical protein n=1 Tax=Pseudoalteromonas TaxID=53246 RepID=UPI0002315E86|nr:hypothetical protein [Pseudoalteromonas sp. BSi20495]GAA78328.1 hypothetical protein P20495_0819 [Pseudoalteromonas sp. BSi20495]
MPKHFIATLLIVLSFNLNANNSFEEGKVTKIILHDWGRVLVYLDKGITTKEDCERKIFLVLNKNNQHFQEMYSSLLAAYHASSKVSGWVNTCDPKHNSPVLTRLDLLPK